MRRGLDDDTFSRDLFLELRPAGEVDSLFDARIRSTPDPYWRASTERICLQPVGFGALTATLPPVGSLEVPTPIAVTLTPTPLSPDLALQSHVEDQLVINVHHRIALAVTSMRARGQLGGQVGSDSLFERGRSGVTNIRVVEPGQDC